MLTSDLWPPKSNQVMLPQGVVEISCSQKGEGQPEKCDNHINKNS